MRWASAWASPAPPEISADQWRRSYITIIRRNWHLLPYEQLTKLLGWTPEKLAETLREDDFLFVKLGSLKPRCEPLKYTSPDEKTTAREAEIARILHESFPQTGEEPKDPLFGFVSELSKAPTTQDAKDATSAPSRFSPRFCYSYFALYGDPLLEPEADPFPDGYLARLAQSGVDGVWLQGVLPKLTPFPWDPNQGTHHEERLKNLRTLVVRAKKHGIGVYLYLNEPRALPLTRFNKYPELKGVTEGDVASLCTSAPEVRDAIRKAIAQICREVPDLAGFFTITASENLTNCWSHGRGGECPRCGKRKPADVIAEVNETISQGIEQAKSHARLIAWDWGWADEWTPAIIERLSQDAALMSVSEWSLPLRRGGVDSSVGEYSISAIGPGPRATTNWGLARQRGLKSIAKIQANNTWELSAVPYIPAVENVARHAANLRQAHVDGMMLGWTLGGYPSPNLEVVAELGRSEKLTVEEAMDKVASRRFGPELAPAAVAAWHTCSAAFSEFPYQINVLYQAPLQMGPANLLWGEPTGYKASMVGLPYDDLESWRAVFPTDVFIGQFKKVADGFERAAYNLRQAALDINLKRDQAHMLAGELNVMDACAIHFRSVANQSRFVAARQALAGAITKAVAARAIKSIEEALHSEIRLAQRLEAIQRRDSRIGFEATNQYYYVPLDLAEKVLNCRDLLDRWLPAQRARHGLEQSPP